VTAAWAAVDPITERHSVPSAAPVAIKPRAARRRSLIRIKEKSLLV
jgi:hypothetical protein